MEHWHCTLCGTLQAHRNTVCHSMFEEQCVTLTLCHSKPCHTVSHTVSEEQYLTATLFNCVLVRPCKPGFSPSCLPCLSCLLSKHSSRASQTYSISGVNQFRELRGCCCPSCCCEEKVIWGETQKKLGRVGFKKPVSLPETKEEKLGGDERISKRSEENQENWE